jgi:hypothetical protein
MSSNNDLLYKVPKSTTQPSINQSHLTIHLNHPEKHGFRPGELIMGAVILVSFVPVQTPIIITLTLSGTSSVTVHPISTKQTTRKKEKLFQLSQVLTQNEVSISSPTVVSLPFTFNFPSHFVDVHGKQEILPTDIKCNALSPTNPSEGSISYKIKAKSLSSSNTLTSSVNLCFTNPRTIKSKDIPTIGKGATRTISYRQSPETNKARPTRTRDSLPWNKTKNNEEQKLTFDFRLWHPTKIINCHHFPVKLEIAALNMEDVKGKGVLPEFRLAKPIEIEVKSTIKLRDCAEAPNIAQEANLTISEKFTGSSGTGQLMTLDETITLDDFVMKGQSIGPTFTSRYIERSTEIVIRVSIKVMGKEERFFVTCPNIDVLPYTFGHIDDEVTQDLRRVSLVSRKSNEKDDGLPRYEDLGDKENHEEKKDEVREVII